MHRAGVECRPSLCHAAGLTRRAPPHAAAPAAHQQAGQKHSRHPATCIGRYSSERRLELCNIVVQTTTPNQSTPRLLTTLVAPAPLPCRRTPPPPPANLECPLVEHIVLYAPAHGLAARLGVQEQPQQRKAHHAQHAAGALNGLHLEPAPAADRRCGLVARWGW